MFLINAHEVQAAAGKLKHGETIVEARNTFWMNLEEPERFNNLVSEWMQFTEI